MSFLKVHDDGHRAVFELKKLISLGIAKTVDTSHAIADGKHGTHLVKLLRAIHLLELLLKHFRHLTWFNFI